MPRVFALDDERGRREPIIVQSLLLQVPDVRKVALDKIYAAGLTQLDMFYASKPRDIAELTGLAIEVATRVCDKFQAYRRDIAALPPDNERARERERLADLTAELADQHEAYEQAASEWVGDAPARRARLRKEREGTLLQINVLLARLGEVDRIKAIERAPFRPCAGTSRRRRRRRRGRESIAEAAVDGEPHT
jgi:hypothetical protein